MMVERKPWHWIEWMLFIVYTLWIALGMAYLFFKPDIFGDIPFFTMFGLLLASYSVPLVFWRPGYTNKPGFAAAVFLTSGFMQFYLVAKVGQDTSLILIPTLLVGFLSNRKLLPFTGVLFVMCFPLMIGVLIHDNHFISFLERLIDFAMLFGIGVALQRMLTSNMQLQKVLDENATLYELIREQNKVLEQYASQIEHITLLEERNRLAVELHDTVGHTYTSVIMGMDAVSYLMEAAPEKAKEKLDVLRDVTRSGLDEIRRSIHQISPNEDDETVSQRLSRLAREFGTHTGTRVVFRTQGVEANVPKQTRLTLVRCLQESLTNAKRHGMAQSIQISLLFEPHQLLLEVQDDGKGNEGLHRGFGLRGMEERLSALQGTLQIDSREGEGTTVICKVPLAAGP
ncbi:sensor histidine kinase [Paenibacillus oceani]|uniref:histidine kinase n=1 Tax=Paenibacillus oceani TaxID=2772510 RepID=A0A927H1M7_9BACL|nr:sensor histidine kinase [Paenibacillus oceani]MBD2864498.1 sensor histidine kinase [Paenibacillus oceani]